MLETSQARISLQLQLEIGSGKNAWERLKSDSDITAVVEVLQIGLSFLSSSLTAMTAVFH